MSSGATALTKGLADVPWSHLARVELVIDTEKGVAAVPTQKWASISEQALKVVEDNNYLDIWNTRRANSSAKQGSQKKRL